MKQLDSEARVRVLDILQHGRDMTLATLRADGYPQATTLSYVNDGLTLYAGIGLGSQKAENIQHNHKVSATINLDYREWSDIRGVSLAANAEFVQGSEEVAHVAQALLRKFPKAASLSPSGGPQPWPGIIFLRIVPTVISLLDYRQGFGHTELYQVVSSAA